MKVYANFRAGSAVKAAMERTKLTLFTQPAVTGPYIAGMVSAAPTDPVTQTRTPMEASEMAVITGEGLKVVGTDASVGVTLTSATDASKSFFIPASKLSPNTPKKLQFVLPAGITEGQWKVKHGQRQELHEGAALLRTETPHHHRDAHRRRRQHARRRRR